MMSSGSFKELTKGINAYIPTLDLPLPDELIQIIQAYLDKHSPFEESDAQRLQDELINIYQKEVKNKLNRFPIFIAILRHLRPAFTGSARILQWWELLIIPILDHLAEERGLAAEIRLILLEILVYDNDDGDTKNAEHTSAVLSDKLLDVWLQKSTLNAPVADDAAQFLEEQIRLVMVDFGKKRPKNFLVSINKLFVKKEHRAQVLLLLCEFIRYGPPHLHQLLQTPLFDNLLRCLQIDTSTTVVSLALTALTMFLPHIPNDIALHLPSLFNIYRRILFWDRERIAPQETEPPEIDLDNSAEIDKKDMFDWEKLSYSAESDDDSIPELLHYFTFLYGLYPINFMSYIRKPERYLRHANFDGHDDVEVQPSEIRQRSEPFREVHLLHLNFYTMTIESELTDPNRWMRSEAADVVASCMALCGPMYPALNDPHGAPPSEQLFDISNSQHFDGDDLDPPLLARNDNVVYPHRVSTEGPDASWRNTTSTIVDSPDGSRRPSSAERKASQSRSIPLADSPTLGPLDERTDSPTLPLQNLPTDSEGRPDPTQPFLGTFQQSLPNESQVSVLSSHQREPSVADSYLQSLEQHQMGQSPAFRSSPGGPESSNISLHREIILLKNELNFERYLKQQHYSHIGQLRRKHVREATAEAETQYLVNSNKSLKTKLEDAKTSITQLKKESDKSRLQAKKWEADLTSKLRVLREEQKKWSLEMDALREDLESARETTNQLRQLVVSSEAKDLTSRLKLNSIEGNIDEIERLRAEVDRLTGNLRTLEAREVMIERAKASEALALTKVEILEMKLKSRDNEINMAKLATSHEIESLRMDLEQTKLDPHFRQSKGLQTMLDNALAVSRTRLAEAHEANANLTTKYANLQRLYLQARDHRNADEPLLSSSGGYPHIQIGHNYLTGSPPGQRTRRRGLSDPDGADRSSQSLASTSENSSSHMPIRPVQTEPVNRAPRPSSQEEVRSTPQSLGGSGFISHNRSGSADSAQVSGMSSLDVTGKPKIKPQSDIRVYGRGGVQNVGSTLKDKKKDKKKEEDKKDKKVAGIRGIRGFS